MGGGALKGSWASRGRNCRRDLLKGHALGGYSAGAMCASYSNAGQCIPQRYLLCSADVDQNTLLFLLLLLLLLLSTAVGA